MKKNNNPNMCSLDAQSASESDLAEGRVNAFCTENAAVLKHENWFCVKKLSES